MTPEQRNIRDRLDQVWADPARHDKWHGVAAYDDRNQASSICNLLKGQNGARWEFEVRAAAEHSTTNWILVGKYNSLRSLPGSIPAVLNDLDKILEAHQ